MARQLLCKLLSHPRLVISLDSSGETALASVVHNPRCIEKLAALSAEKTTPTDAPAPPSRSPSVKTVDEKRETEGEKLISATSSRETVAGIDGGIGSNRAPNVSLRFLPYVSLGGDDAFTKPSASDPPVPILTTPLDHTYTRDDAFNPITTGHTLSSGGLAAISLEHASQDMDCDPSPALSNKEATTSLLTNRCLQAMGVPPTPDESELAVRMRNVLQDTIKAAAHEIKQEVMDMVDKEVLDKLQQSKALPDSVVAMFGKGSSQTPPTIFKRNLDPQSGSQLGNVSSEVLTTSSMGGSTHLVQPTLLNDIPSSSSLGDGSNTSSESVAPIPSMPLLFGKGSSLSTLHLKSLRISSKSNLVDLPPSSNFNAVETLFSNWPSIITTILGFNPVVSDQTSSGHAPSPPTVHLFSSAHILDSFTTHLILNCSSHVTDCFVNTIVKKLNSAVEQIQDRANEADTSLLLQDIDYSDHEGVARYLEAEDVGVAILVGRRFLSSVVRVLALEHSRVKNKFVEMHQQARQGIYIHVHVCVC